MCAQNNVVFNIKGILRVAGGMVFRQIEQLKVKQIQFDFRAFYNIKTHSGENLEQLILHQRNRMNASDGRMFARLCNVDRFAFQLLFLLDPFDLAVQRVHLLGQPFAHNVNHLAGLRAFFGRQLPH